MRIAMMGTGYVGLGSGACPVVVDRRNIYHPEDMNMVGFTYVCVGRQSMASTVVEYVSPNLLIANA
jgi:hypothetical protein